jgi:hypothetical protein
VIFVFGRIVFVSYLRFSTGRERREFSGVVADKWTGVAETQQGSKFYWVTLVRSGSGEQIKVYIDPETYEKLRISMPVKHDSSSLRVEEANADSP